MHSDKSVDNETTRGIFGECIAHTTEQRWFYGAFPRKDYAETGPRQLVPQCRNQVSVHPYLALGVARLYVINIEHIAHSRKVSRRSLIFLAIFFDSAVRDVRSEKDY